MKRGEMSASGRGIIVNRLTVDDRIMLEIKLKSGVLHDAKSINLVHSNYYRRYIWEHQNGSCVFLPNSYHHDEEFTEFVKKNYPEFFL